MKIWLVIVGVGLVSLLLRSSFLVLRRGQHLPDWIMSSLGLVPAAVLAALVAPDLLSSPATGTLSLLSPRLLAGLMAAAVAWKTRSVLWTLAVGLGLLGIAQTLGWH